jgi:N-methylhydantoinase B
MPHDPITGTGIQASLTAAADEMFAVLQKTAMSPIIYEVLDVGTGITDAAGELVSSGAGIPTFVGVLDKAVKRIVELHGADAIRPGDLFVTNDPYYGGVTHLNDVVVAQPVFAETTLVAWTASIAHWNDVGGKTLGSMAVDVSEIFQEGLRLPAVKLFEHGRPIASVFDIIAVNSRLPEFVKGDLWAQVAASRKAEARIRQLVETYGLDAYRAALHDLFEEGERRSRAGLKTLPAGVYEIEEEQDDGALWRASIAVAPDRFTVNLRGNPAQRGAPYNTSRDGAIISAQMIFKALADPTLFANAGSFRPLEVVTEPSSIFHASGTAPHGYYFETRIRLYDMLWRCMAEALPERLPAGHFASICGTVIAGDHPDTGRRFHHGRAADGRLGRDLGTRRARRNVFDEPRRDLQLSGRDLRGPLWPRRRPQAAERNERGRWPASRRQGAVARLSPARQGGAVGRLQPQSAAGLGLAGGRPGGRNGIAVTRAGGDCKGYAFVGGLELAPGDFVTINTANGGGWGAPEGDRK